MRGTKEAVSERPCFWEKMTWKGHHGAPFTSRLGGNENEEAVEIKDLGETE